MIPGRGDLTYKIETDMVLMTAANTVSTVPEVSVLAVSDPVTAADANGFKAVILDLLGDYEGVVVEYSYENTNGYTSYVREIQPDYPWIASAIIFLAVLWCTFRMGAAMLCRK